MTMAVFHRLITRSVRNDFASATIAIFFASFCSHLWLFFSYFSSHPHHPNAELGLLYALNNHGSYVYLSAVESTGMGLLKELSFLVFFATIVIVPKEAVLPPPGTPRWLSYLGGTFKTDQTPSTRRNAIFYGSFFLSLAVIYFAGSIIARTLVANGIILQP